MMTYLPALLAALFSTGLVPLSMWIANRYAVMDSPEARKVHRIPTPRIGGIGIIAGVFLAVLATLAIRHALGDPVSQTMLRKLLAIGASGGFIFLVGLVDDIRSVSSRFKLIALIGASVTVCASGVVISSLVFAGESVVEFHWASWFITVISIIAVAVAVSFIDGLDGLAAGLTLLSASVLSLFAASSAMADVAILPLALSGALLGFLLYNWHPAKTFMGDCGSMTIGFLLASCFVLANPEIGTMRGVVLPALAISIPLLEAVLTVFRRRYLQRRSMFSAERGHIHHRLLDRGFSHHQAVIALIGISTLAVGIGMLALSLTGWATLAGLSLLPPLLLGTFKLAGSVRTDEMIVALRSKRSLDRTKLMYRKTFEDMQLEFDEVETFSGWWQTVCRAAERFDFAKVHILLPAGDGRKRDLVWECKDEAHCGGDRMQASIPIVTTKPDGPAACANIEVSGVHTLESAGERIALFARLMTEYSIAAVRRRERLAIQRRLSIGLSVDQSRSIPSSDSSDDGPFSNLRIAIVHDFLYTNCGAERVLEQLLHIFPQSEVYALFDFLPESQRDFLQGRPVTTSFIQRLPFAKTKHRAYLPLMPLAVEQLDVSQFDLVISSSYLSAKGVLTGPDQLHVCYCHSPVRFAWDLHHQYLREAGLGFSARGLMARAILHYIRNWDVRSSLGVDHFVANSQFVARRIRKVYRRNATVIHPPVDTDKFGVGGDERDDFYLVSGRMVPYKRTDLIVRAFRQMPDKHLVVIGEGPGMDDVQQLAGPNVKIMGFQDDDVLVDYMKRAKALIFAAEEDFGIVPVEALSSGTPVIAYGRGGASETVIDGEFGVLFEEQSEESLISAIDRFEILQSGGRFDPDELHRRSLEYSHERFAEEVTSNVLRWVKAKWPTRDFSADDRRGKTESNKPLPDAEIDANAAPIRRVKPQV